jgi:hypothetical protein
MRSTGFHEPVRRAFVGVVLLVSCASHLFAQEPADPGSMDPGFKVVVNEANPTRSLPERTVKRLFMKITVRWPSGERVLPVDQDSRNEVRARFFDAILGGVSYAEAYWFRKIFSGRGHPPPQLISDAAVLAYVHDNPGAVGYVSSETELIPGVAVLTIEPPEKK